MSAILKKAHTLGKISDRSYRKFWQKMGKQGYRTKEPPHLNPPEEHPTLFQELIDYHLEDLGYKADEVGELIILDESEYNYCYLPTNRRHLRVA